MLPRINPNDTIKPAYLEFLNKLTDSTFSGEIKSDYASRLTVATDNSIYQVIPQAVLFPRTIQDIVTIFSLSTTEIHFTPRGGGTGTNGQSLSAGIIIDCSKFMRDILEVNLTERWVRVQPGVVLDQLNQSLKPFNMHFAPEISPSNRATIGGMINTDACGNGSKTLGRTSDHVIALTCILHDGTIIKTDENHLMNDAIKKILQPHQELIKEKFFAAPRTLSGYNLAKAQQNLNYLFCGSEGTLGVIAECKLKLSPIPAIKKLVVIKYRNFNDALRAKEITADIKPLVIETIDEKLIQLASQDSIHFHIKSFIEEANAINLVEFVGDDETSIDQQITALCNNIANSSTASGFYLAKNAAEIKLLWELRKKSVGLISKRQDGTRRPIPFVEDTAVPPEKLADYIIDFKKLLDSHQLIYGMYGHIDAGCIHVRPALDTKLVADEKLIRFISDEVVQLVKKYGGVIWGEHGKGFRSEYGREFFGDTLYHVLRQIKTLFDPYNKLNPGKIATPLESSDNLVKVDGPFKGYFDKEISQHAAHEFSSAISCNGNGACFNFSTQDPMCPSYKVTKDRIHSPKGRATVIREWLRQLTKENYSFAGKSTNFTKFINCFRKQKDFSHEVYNALSGCLACKACTNQCPLSVDIPDLKAKFLTHYHRRYARKLRDYLIANAENIACWQAKFPRIANSLIENKLGRYFFKHVFKLVDAPRAHFSNTPLKKLPQLGEKLSENSIILLQDAFTSFYEPNVLLASYQFFSVLGFNVYVAPFFQNGKAFHVKGFLAKFTKIAQRNIAYLEQLATFNVPLVGIDPSITLTYRDEYQKLSPTEKLRFSVLLPQEFLQLHLNKLTKLKTTATYYLISHCTEKTMHAESEQQWKNVFLQLGITLHSLAAGCCGMAGSYGHEKEHVRYSKELFDMDWKQYIATHSNVLATGYSCRSQANRFSHIKLQHPLQALITLFNFNNKESS